jgi:hypothetical protein
MRLARVQRRARSDFRSALERLRQQRHESLDGIGHLRNQSLAQTISVALQNLGEPGLGEGLFGALREKSSGIGHGQCFVEKRQLAAEVVLLEVSEQDVGLAGPRPNHAWDLGETLITSFLEQLSQDPQSGVAAGVDDVIGFARPLGYHERLAETVGADRSLDAVVFRVGCSPGVVFVGVDPENIEGHQLEPVRILPRAGTRLGNGPRHGRSSATIR